MRTSYNKNIVPA